ncbi:hypothetical protein B296_00031055 [Ensete ventricosum]|uniref:Uncharacterized protein n=1 Tax=Ensete ventricosum TaxID=4639 RepID=A0A426XIT5_ENSVE|nr:hypothetical protein B296_00031055 [Ensete ventricosum]
MFNLGKIKSGGGASSGLATPSTTSASSTVGVAVTIAKKHLDTDVGASLRKRRKRAAPKQPVDAFGSTTKAPGEKGKEPVGRGKEPMEVEEVPEQGYSIRELCEAANKELKLGANQDLVAATEHRAKELEETMGKLRTELESLKNQRKGLEQETSILCSSLDRARDDRDLCSSLNQLRGRCAVAD